MRVKVIASQRWDGFGEHTVSISVRSFKVINIKIEKQEGRLV